MKNILFLLTTIILLASCGGSKNISSTRDNRDSLALVEKDRKLAEMTRELEDLRAILREHEYTDVLFEPAINFDSLRAVLIEANCSQKSIDEIKAALEAARATIKRMADGTVEITGQIRSLKHTSDKQQEIISSQARTIERLENELTQAKTNVKTETVEKIREIKRVPWWIWLAIFGGFCLGGIITWRIKQ